MTEIDVMFLSGMIVILANFITKRSKFLIEVAGLGLLIVSFIIYIIITP
jgi:hypothetical protein